VVACQLQRMAAEAVLSLERRTLKDVLRCRSARHCSGRQRCGWGRGRTEVGEVRVKESACGRSGAKSAARLAHEQSIRRAAEDDLGVWRKVHWQAENYSTVPTV